MRLPRRVPSNAGESPRQQNRKIIPFSAHRVEKSPNKSNQLLQNLQQLNNTRFLRVVCATFHKKGYQNDRKTPIDVRQAVMTIKNAILQSQYRAAKVVNSEQLSLYFGIGRYVSEHSRKGVWGTGAIERISEQLQKELPGLRGFGSRQIKYMRSFYEEWQKMFDKSAALAADLPKFDQKRSFSTSSTDLEDVDYTLLLAQNRQPMAADMMNEFLSVGFTHHIEIITKSKDLQERLFYIHQTFVNHWDKYRLREMLKSDLFHHQGNLPNNFTTTMQNAKNALQAIGMFKDDTIYKLIL